MNWRESVSVNHYSDIFARYGGFRTRKQVYKKTDNQSEQEEIEMLTREEYIEYITKYVNQIHDVDRLNKILNYTLKHAVRDSGSIRAGDKTDHAA